MHPKCKLPKVHLQQVHHIPQVAPISSVVVAFDETAYIPDIISARSLVVGEVHVTPLFECDYIQNCTPLYKQLEQEDWQRVDEFLSTGIWSDSLSKDPLSQAQQVRTWVTCFDKQHHDVIKCHWSVLPLQYV
jgi:hypothetical protein